MQPLIDSVTIGLFCRIPAGFSIDRAGQTLPLASVIACWRHRLLLAEQSRQPLLMMNINNNNNIIPRNAISTPSTPDSALLVASLVSICQLYEAA